MICLFERIVGLVLAWPVFFFPAMNSRPSKPGWHARLLERSPNGRGMPRPLLRNNFSCAEIDDLIAHLESLSCQPSKKLSHAGIIAARGHLDRFLNGVEYKQGRGCAPPDDESPSGDTAAVYLKRKF